MNFIFLKSVFIGLSISIPIGPVGILCLQRLFTRGPWVGLASGLGAAAADVVYALLAAICLTVIETNIHLYEQHVRIIGSIALCILGIVVLLNKPEPVHKRLKKLNLQQAFFSTFFIVLSNPAVIFMFLALLSMTNVATMPLTWFSAVRIGAGVFTGSALWWIMLGIASEYYNIRFNEKTLNIINTIAGCSITGFGILGLILAGYKLMN